jgi:hypothetical protein
MTARKVIVSTCIVVAGTVFAQDQYSWVNADLQQRQMPQEQYIAIGRGHLAQCQASAAREARATTASRVSSCNWNALPMACAAQKGQAEREGNELQQTLFVGCMAEKGWVWTKAQ